MRLHEQTGYKLYDYAGRHVNVPTESMTVSNLVDYARKITGKSLYTWVRSEKEVWLLESPPPDGKVLFRLQGNPRSCCS